MSGASETIPPNGRVIGIDWGSNRIGIAISDAARIVATPLAVLRYRIGKRLPLGDFLTLVENQHPVGMVVGIPYDDDGNLGESARQARAMGELFSARSGLPVEWIDESFSTAEATDRLRRRGVSPQSRRDDVDARAAAVLLEQWLEQRRERK
jgi:putative Holliday junction resolvase